MRSGDDYNDVGAAPSWRAASRYRLNDRIALRGSVGAGARPPGLALLSHEASQSTAWECDSGGGENPCKLREAVHNVVPNPALDPERSRTVSLGAAIDLGRVSIGADWFRMELSRTP